MPRRYSVSRVALKWVSNSAILSLVPNHEKPSTPRKPFTGRGLVREVSYLHEDEARALEARAKKDRCSKAEVIRRALRGYLKIED
jgi:hypothetical protein